MNVQLFLPNETFKGSILIEDGKIKEIGKSLFKEDENTQRFDGKGLNLISGFIDGHIHGANGSDVMDGTITALKNISSVLPSEGTTAYLATTITNPIATIEQAIRNVNHYVQQGLNKQGQAEILGIHLEGPFIEKAKTGAQPKEDIIKPNVQTFQRISRLN
jgi:N-acetylglucosamine-6-phosphate deacetylase